MMMVKAREFLRAMLVGKQVSFAVEHTTPTGREYGTVLFNGESVAHLLVAEGFATVCQPCP